MHRVSRFVGHILHQQQPFRGLSSRLMSTQSQVEVMVVGCGVPKKAMGWYHAKQLLEGRCPSAKLTQIVEPWLLGAGASSEPGQEFKAWAAGTGAELFSAVPTQKGGGKKVAIIASRTADMPALFFQCLEAGCSAIYLEKPGAPSWVELERMASSAAAAGVPVYMGYNKNVTKYVTEAREAEAKIGSDAAITFVHNNAVRPEELDECFERNAEGMLKNMAVHELALLCTYYGVTVDTIKTVTPDMAYSQCETRGKFTDFSKVGFTIETVLGKKVSVQADRCGGSFSEALVTVNGVVQFHSKTPDAALEAEVQAHETREPGLMPYFYLQDQDYVTLKERVAASVLTGTPPQGLASLQVAIDALKVAEYLETVLKKALL